MREALSRGRSAQVWQKQLRLKVESLALLRSWVLPRHPAGAQREPPQLRRPHPRLAFPSRPLPHQLRPAYP